MIIERLRQFAIGLYLAEMPEVENYESMLEVVRNGEALHWEAFEHWSGLDVAEEIENTAEALVRLYDELGELQERYE